MTPKRQISSYLPHILLFTILGVGVFGYFKYTSIIEKLRLELSKFNEGEKAVQEEFGKVNQEYKALISTLSDKDKLLIEKESNLAKTKNDIEALLSKDKVTSNDLADAKALIAVLKAELKFDQRSQAFKNRIDSLQQIYKTNILKFENTIKEKESLIKSNEKIIKNNTLQINKQKDIIAKGGTLRLLNFNIQGINVRANGKEEVTDKARKADKLRVSFNVNDDNISESGTKTIYLSVYTADGNLAKFEGAKAGTLTLENGNRVEYSDTTTFEYIKGESKTIQFDWENDDFPKGDYVMKVYQNGNLIGAETKSFR